MTRVEPQGFGEGGHLGLINRGMVPDGRDRHQSPGASTWPARPPVSVEVSLDWSAGGGAGVASRPTSPMRRKFLIPLFEAVGGATRRRLGRD